MRTITMAEGLLEREIDASLLTADGQFLEGKNRY